jgi:hypothetical protein
MQVTLAVISGPYTGQHFTFDRPERFLVGRSKQAHFRLRPDRDKGLRGSQLQFLVEVNPPLCRLYDLLTGQPIYESEEHAYEAMMRVVNSEPRPLRQPPEGPSMPRRIGEVICRALARHPRQRFPDVLVMREALLRAV